MFVESKNKVTPSDPHLCSGSLSVLVTSRWLPWGFVWLQNDFYPYWLHEHSTFDNPVFTEDFNTQAPVKQDWEEKLFVSWDWKAQQQQQELSENGKCW